MEPEQTVERRIVSILFGDIVGFTPLGERLDAEDVATVQDAYFAAVREIITRYGGRVEKFIGDAAMAVFGLPRTRDDDAERAVRAGLALVAAVEQLGPRLGLEEAALRLRVGVNTGEVVAVVGGPDEWRVTGDTVNTAARLQTAAPPGGVLVGEATALSVAAAAELEETGPLTLKGKAVAVRGWIVTGMRPARSREHAMGRLAAPMLGRGKELAALVRAIADAGGRTRRILVVAPPGVGKSRLLDELAGDHRHGGLVLRAQVRREADAPFSPVTRLAVAALAAAGWRGNPGGSDAARSPAVADVAALLARTGVAAGRAEVLATELVRLLDPEPASVATATADRDRRFDAWIEVLDRLAGDRAVAWLLEDLHWAGPDLLAFLDRVHATPRPAGRVVIGTARPSLLETQPAWCGPREPDGIERMDLRALDEGAADELVRTLVGAAIPEPLVARIAARSDGNPLFIEELLRTWISVGILSGDAGGAWHLEDEAAAGVELPSTVQAIYAAQIDDLPPGARRLARHGSVAGRAFPYLALEALDAGDPDAVERLLVRALIEGPAEADLGPSYRYRHILLRDAGYATLARAERSRLHARLASWMASAAGSRPERVAESIARQYLAALRAMPALAPPGSEMDRAALERTTAGWLERAATVALAEGAPASARELIDEALRLTPADAGTVHARRRAIAGDATAFSGDMDVAMTAYSDAAETYATLAAAAVDATTRAEARSGQASAVLAQGTLLIEQLEFKAAQALAERTLESVGAVDDLAAGRLHFLRAWARIAYRPGAEVLPDLEAAMRGAEQGGDDRLRLETMNLLQGLRMDMGEATPAEAMGGYQEIAALAERTGNVRRAVGALRSRGLIVIDTDPAGGLGWVDRAAALAEAHGLLEEVAWCHYARTELGFVGGDWDSAVAEGLAALEIAEPNAYHRAVVRTWFTLSPIAMARGRRDILERAKTWFDPRRETFPDSPYGRFMHTAVDLRFASAGLLEPFLPDEGLFDAWEEPPGSSSWQAATETIVGAWIDGGRLDLVDRALAAIRRWETHAFATAPARGIADVLEGRLRLARGDGVGARELAGRALAAFADPPIPWGALLAHQVLAAAAAGSPKVSDTERAAAMANLRTSEAALGIGPPPGS